MFILPFIFVIVCWVFFSGSKSAEVFCRLFIYVYPLEIQLSRGEGYIWDPINRINPTTFLCLSQTWTRISNDNVMCRGLFNVQWVHDERWLFILLILVELLTITVLNFLFIISFVLLDLLCFMHASYSTPHKYSCVENIYVIKGDSTWANPILLNRTDSLNCADVYLACKYNILQNENILTN